MSRGAFTFAPLGPFLTPDEATFFREGDPWGFILFQRNCETPEQLRRLTGDLREAVGWHAPILIDQEGGRVQRMRGPHWREWMPPLDQVEAFEDPGRGVRAMYLRGALIGAELVAHGVDVNCAPSGDIAYPQTHAFLRNRCYGRDAQTVIVMARACAEGLMDAGCLTVLKHAPGHGRAQVDSHKDLPTIEVPLAELKATDFAPFRALADTGMAMTAHIVVPEIDGTAPITQSAAGISYLRQQLGMTGLLMSDDVSMNALAGDVVTRGQAALAAGCDLVLHCNGEAGEMEAIAAGLGRMGPEAAKRADIALAARRTTRDIDIPALEAEFEALMQGA
ncbi:beta-N-acetylhexosaminidase [Boseongicola aestuarii]|uniref:beta-N-acetylhexosaminidase n=1 Tax=Boseongicola aestuarii TaxID=1470561 RepID=A0A238IXB7_9RHOB|nr:beta-N-acetylhexosaminidase [Boseongicola aestuarii]SMX22324.1 Beta-hexosaminidase [Boseongicola aestuarii]